MLQLQCVFSVQRKHCPVAAMEKLLTGFKSSQQWLNRDRQPGCKTEERKVALLRLPIFFRRILKLAKQLRFPYPSLQCGLRCFFVSSITPSNHCQNVKFLPGKLSCKILGLKRNKKEALRFVYVYAIHQNRVASFVLCCAYCLECTAPCL